MVKIKKNVNTPSSLNSENIESRREELVSEKRYIDESKYNDCYKNDDTKEALGVMYNYKCVYCEQRLGRDSSFHVEHYRPKSRYYWIAYSWDNLLYCCAKCNSSKGTKFETMKVSIVAPTDEDLKNIHSLTKEYNKLEKPKLINPEVENIEKDIEFFDNGFIYSENERVQYTIDSCNLNRDSILNERAKLFNDFFKKKYLRKLREYQVTKNKDYLIQMKGLLEDFIEDSKDKESDFLAFRRWIVKSRKEFEKFR